jgi:hypothetical protein
MSGEKDPITLVKAFREAENRDDIDAVIGMFVDDAEFERVGQAIPKGKENKSGQSLGTMLESDPLEQQAGLWLTNAMFLAINLESGASLNKPNPSANKDEEGWLRKEIKAKHGASVIKS